jgi:hypothetical protein
MCGKQRRAGGKIEDQVTARQRTIARRSEAAALLRCAVIVEHDVIGAEMTRGPDRAALRHRKRQILRDVSVAFGIEKDGDVEAVGEPLPCANGLGTAAEDQHDAVAGQGQIRCRRQRLGAKRGQAYGAGLDCPAREPGCDVLSSVAVSMAALPLSLELL